MHWMRATAFAVCLLALVGAGCGTAPEAPEAEETAEPGQAPETLQPVEPAEEEEIELAIHMGRMQRHAEKLGYSIQGENAPLATFYLEEVGEVLEVLLDVEMHDGMPISHPAGVILAPELPPLEASLEVGDWEGARSQYEVLIDACNRCHAATAHQFIQIVPVQGEPPYSQRFAVE